MAETADNEYVAEPSGSINETLWDAYADEVAAVCQRYQLPARDAWFLVILSEIHSQLINLDLKLGPTDD